MDSAVYRILLLIEDYLYESWYESNINLIQAPTSNILWNVYFINKYYLIFIKMSKNMIDFYNAFENLMNFEDTL